MNPSYLASLVSLTLLSSFVHAEMRDTGRCPPRPPATSPTHLSLLPSEEHFHALAQRECVGQRPIDSVLYMYLHRGYSPASVWFQDSNRYPRHTCFISAHPELPGFAELTHFPTYAARIAATTAPSISAGAIYYHPSYSPTSDTPPGPTIAVQTYYTSNESPDALDEQKKRAIVEKLTATRDALAAAIPFTGGRILFLIERTSWAPILESANLATIPMTALPGFAAPHPCSPLDHAERPLPTSSTRPRQAVVLQQ